MKKLMALIAALVMVSGLAYADDAWDFYGSARVSTFMVDTEIPGSADVDTYAQALQGNSRIGANVKVSDELTGRFEYGTGVNVRILWGEWNFGAGSLGVGQHYTPLNWFYSNQVYGTDNDLLFQGGIYSGREDMIRLKFGDFQVAMLGANTAGIGAYSTVDSDIPAVEVSYALKMDAFSLNVGAGYQTYEVSNGTNALDVNSWVVAVGGKANFGPVYVAGNLWTGENAGSILVLDTGGAAAGLAGINAAGTAIADNEALGFIAVIGAKINDMFSVEAGYAALTTDLDESATDDDSSSYYVQSTITLAPGVMIIPEIGVIDYEEDTQTEVTYVGAKWQINF